MTDSDIQSAEQTALNSINQADMLAQVETWCATNSGTGNLQGLAHVADYLTQAFAVLPGTVNLVDPDAVDAVQKNGAVTPIQRGQHLHVCVRPDAPNRILLTGHMDTVFPVNGSFQSLSWRDDNILNGPGVADMKGGIAVMLAALKALETSPFATKMGYDVMINSDEEVGSGSSAALIARLARNKLAALTYEPALPDGTLAGERGGSGNFSVIITGLSAHAGRNPQDGRNAIVAAADLALRLKALTRDDLSINPARIDGGGANNVVPDHAILRVNFRPATPAAQQFAQTQLDDLVVKMARLHDVTIHVHGGFGRPPKPIDPPAAKLFGLVKLCGAQLGLDISWARTGGVCDGNNIAACGVPVVDTMGVRGGDIHSDQEFLIVDSLAERARLSALVIMRMAQKGAL